ncbi:MAG: ribose 5-phosphate isomerase A [Candidatus Heimdallarchaeota archaeon]|nr:ribose 5-phosphate isomerase A [Candidatus Heimdallarchaeota archaeon]
MTKKIDDSKINAALRAAKDFIYDDLTVGIGTGSTVNYFIQALSELVEKDELDILCVPSSIESKIELAKAGLSTGSLIEESELDIYIDGADIITKNFVLIKGGGGALTMEKIMARASEEFIVIADYTKYPRDLNSFPVPIEIIPQTVNTIIKPIFDLGGEFRLRYGTGKIGPVISDNGNIIGDVHFNKSFDPSEMEKALKLIPGVVENGIFPKDADRIIIGYPDSSELVFNKSEKE